MYIEKYVDLIAMSLFRYVQSEIKASGFFDDSDESDNILYLCLIEAERILEEIGNELIEASDLAILAEHKIIEDLNKKYYLLETEDSYGCKTRIYSKERYLSMGQFLIKNKLT